MGFRVLNAACFILSVGLTLLMRPWAELGSDPNGAVRTIVMGFALAFALTSAWFLRRGTSWRDQGQHLLAGISVCFALLTFGSAVEEPRNPVLLIISAVSLAYLGLAALAYRAELARYRQSPPPKSF
ncbi:MAG: hypothetical protein AAF411_05895 [Myxococcota bacterium]